MISNQIKTLLNKNSTKVVIKCAIKTLARNIDESTNDPNFDKISDEIKDEIYKESGLNDDEKEKIKDKLKKATNETKDDDDITETSRPNKINPKLLQIFGQTNESICQKNQIQSNEKIDINENTLTIDKFNSLTLTKQKFFIEKYINNENISNINKLLIFLEKFQYIKCFQIVSEEPNELLINKIKENKDLSRIKILNNATENLYKHNMFNLSDEFISILNDFKEIILELKNTTKESDLPQKIGETKAYKNGKIKILLVILGETSSKFNDNQFINYVKFDSLMNKSLSSFTYLSNSSISSSIKKIEPFSFCNCIKLEKVIIPSQITHIGENSFQNCSSLYEISDLLSVELIGNSSFEGCQSLKKIEIGSSLSFLGIKAFKKCKSLEMISFNSSISIIKQETFSECSSLKEIKIPQSVTEIEESSFENCKSLNEIIIPLNVTKIGMNAFCGCSELSKITIESISIKIIDKSTFAGCSSLIEIKIPDSITEIEESSFENCKSLNELNIPLNVTKIGNKSFKGCTSLSKILIPKTIYTIGENSFEDCKSLNEIEIPSSISSIGIDAFKNCSSLTKLTIPSIESLGKNSLNGCSKLTHITIPNGTEIISNYAFAGLTDLKTITIPQSVTEIGKNSFENCKSLNEIIIPLNVTKIGMNAFCGCSELSKITIESISIKMIDKSTFAGCSSLIEIKIPDSIIEIEESSFENCKSLNEIIIPLNVTKIGMSSFKNCTSLTKIIFETSLINTIEMSTFSGCSSLKEVNIPQSITKIEENSFRDCNSLTSITIPDSVSKIGPFSFYECSSLVEIVIPPLVTEIGPFVFSNCTSLVRITIPESVTQIDNDAFYGCTSLKEIIIPSLDKINQIEDDKAITETTNENNESLPVVFDIGTSVCRIGFAGKKNPKEIFPTEISKPKSCVVFNSENKKVTPRVGKEILNCRSLFDSYLPFEDGIINDENNDIIESILNYGFKILKIDPKKHTLIIPDSPFHYFENRRKLADILFHKFEVPFVVFGIRANFSLINEKAKTGIFVDCGDVKTSVIPIFKGNTLYDFADEINLGGRDITIELQKMFDQKLTFDQAKMVKEKFCKINCSDKKISQLYIESNSININGNDVKLGDEVYQCTEILFKKGIQNLIFDSIQKLYPEYQKKFVKKIYLMGGTAKIKGFCKRLEKELFDLSVEKNSFFGEFKVNLVSDPELTAWRGASKYSMLKNINKIAISKEDYTKDENSYQCINKRCF